jgi:dolichyl-phosphate beta-glucosyltransferase
MAYDNYEQWKTTPNSGQPHLSIVIPAYNEAVRIVPTIGAIASHVSDLGFEWELIVADDGSTDNTVLLTQALGFANLHVLVAEKNGGKGSAVRRGMLAATGKYVLFCDADNSTPIEEVSGLLHKLEHEGYAVAIGSRAAEGGSEGNKSFFRQFLSDGLRWMVWNLMGIQVRDTQCGFKMYTEDASQLLHSTQTIDGFSFDLEILYLAFREGLPVAECPVTWVDAPGSTVNTRKEIVRFLTDMMRIKRNEWSGIYKERLENANRVRVHAPAG